MSGHGIDVCVCGAVIAQCRCPGPHETRVAVIACPKCVASGGTHEAKIQASYAAQAMAESMRGVNLTGSRA